MRVMYSDLASAGWHGRGQHRDKMIKVLEEELLPLVEKEIILTMVHGEGVMLAPQDKIRIYLWAYLRDEVGYQGRQEELPDTLYGKQYCQDKVYCPSGLGELIVSPEGIPVAEYFKETNQVIILFDIADNGSEDEIYIFTQIIKELIKLMFKGLNIEEIKEERQRRLNDILFQNILNVLVEAENSTLRNKQQRFESIKRRITECKNDLIAYIRERDMLMKEIESLNDIPKIKEKIAKEIKSLTELPFIKKIDFSNEYGYNYINLYMDNIIATDKHNRRYYIGDFKVSIKTSSCDFKFINLNNKRVAFWSGGLSNHPHVDVNGNACLGEISSAMAEAWATKEFTALATLLYMFLCQANIDDPAGARVTAWDEVDDNGNIIPKNTQQDNTQPQRIRECVICGRTNDEENVFECEYCGDYVCEGCIICNDDDDIFCSHECLERFEIEREED